MGLFSRGNGAPPPRPAGTDWSQIDAVRAEWPPTDLDAMADLSAWRQGMQLYETRDDYSSMIEAGALMCRALRHQLYGSGILVGGDLPETTHRVLFAASTAPPDGQSFPTPVAAQLRLALTVVKQHRWQSAEHGGGGMMESFLLARSFLFTSAVAPSPDRLIEGNLRAFFTTNLVDPIVDQAPAPPTPTPADPAGLRTDGEAALASLERTIAEAEAGDPAAAARSRGVAAAASGDLTTALQAFEAAAQLGDVDAMYDAGCVARDLDQPSQSSYWFEQAAGSGHGLAAYNLGAQAYSIGDRASATRWWEQAARAGQADAYAALTQLADETGDAAAELHWSRLGAEAGQPFCQLRQGQLVLRANPSDHALIRQRVLPLFERAADAGMRDALFLLGIAHGTLGDRSTSRAWLERAEAAGDADATRVLREQGLV